MATIHQLTIRNFRGIKEFSQLFTSDFVCLIGRGDSGKSTILEAIGAVLSSNWNMSFFDNDFHDCNTTMPIVIEATLKNVPEELLREDKFGLYQRGIAAETGEIRDDVEDEHQPALTVRIEVTSDLEPKWSVTTEREIGSRQISAADRAKLNTVLVSDYVDRHFSWSKGGPLYTLLQQEDSEDNDGTHMIDALRDAKSKIDGVAFSKFDTAMNKVKATASIFGINIARTSTTIDFRDIVNKDGKVSLHDEKIPFRLKGKGSKRIISIAIQSAIAEAGGIALIDEIEQGLEPDRVQQLINSLKTHTHGQVFITTHSRDVLVELSAENLFLMRNGATGLVTFDKQFQGTLRKNPEAFFAKCTIVCEGPTEVGVCKSLNEYRISKLSKNMAYIGIRLADGGGNTMVNYARAFRTSGFPVCLFCDSDETAVNTQKAALAATGIDIIDWDNDDCLERAVMRDLPFAMLKEAFEIAVTLRHDGDSSTTVDAVKTSMWDSVKAKFGAGCPQSMDVATDSLPLRVAMAASSVQKEKEWFKSQMRGYRLGKMIFDRYDELPDCKLRQQLEALSTWIDNNGS